MFWRNLPNIFVFCLYLPYLIVDLKLLFPQLNTYVLQLRIYRSTLWENQYQWAKARFIPTLLSSDGAYLLQAWLFLLI